ncbi:MAG: hypothetical protein ACJA1T_000332 [Zhongshania aliphaticivorans]|jgi:hypothetical protein
MAETELISIRTAQRELPKNSTIKFRLDPKLHAEKVVIGVIRKMHHCDIKDPDPHASELANSLSADGVGSIKMDEPGRWTIIINFVPKPNTSFQTNIHVEENGDLLAELGYPGSAGQTVIYKLAVTVNQ